MSSLRLALKQSLAESGHLMEEEKEKQERKKKREAERRRREARKRRQQGRRQKRKDDEGRSQSSSSLSSSSESSSGSDDDDDDDDSSTSSNDSRSSAEGSSSGSGSSSDDDDSRSSTKEVEMEGVFDSEVSSDDEEDDSARRDAKQKKRAKNAHRGSAAAKIQAQWKKKGGGGGGGGGGSKKKDGGMGSDSSAQKKKKSGGNKKKSSSQQQTCPPPSQEIITWMRQMSVQMQRRHMERGLRVKVRFVTKSNKRGKDGKPLRRLKWYGGLVTDIATGGKRIRIKYDDGTSEVADFPDKDIVVDNEGNGHHRHGTQPEVFHPPPPTKRRTPSPRERPTSVEFEVKEEKDSSRDRTDGRVPEIVSSPVPPKQKHVRTPTASKSEANVERKRKSPSPEHLPPQIQQTPTSGTTTKASAVSESPFSPAHNSAAASTPSSSSSSASTSSSSRSGSPDGKGKNEGGAGKKRKRVNSPVPATVQMQKEASEPTAKDGADLPNDHRPKSLHIKLIPPKLTKGGSDKNLGGARPSKPTKNDSKPPRNDTAQVDESVDSMDVDDADASNGGNIARKKPESPKDGKEGEASDSKGSEQVHPESKKRGSSPVLSDSANEPPRKKALTEPPTLVDKGAPDEKDAAPAPAPAPAPAERTEAKPSKVADIASKSTAFTSYSGGSAKPTISEPKKESVESDIAKAKPAVSSAGISSAKKVDSPESASKPPERSSTPVPPSDESLSNKKHDGESQERPPGPVEQKNPDTRSKSPPKSDENAVATDGDGKEKPASLSSEGSGLRLASETEPSKSPASSSRDGNRGRRPRVKLPPVARSGRRAAQKANELIVSKEERIIQDEFAKPKKKKEHPDLKLFPTSTKSFDEDDSDDDDEDDDEHWVQCDRCEKWRLLPTTVQMDTLPDRWFCELNIYDPLRNNCEAAEQTAQEILKEKKAAEAAEKKKLASASPRPKSKSPVTSADNAKGGRAETEAPSKRTCPAPKSNEVTDTRTGESRSSEQKAKRRSPVTVDPAVAKSSDSKNSASLSRSLPPPKPRADAATAVDDGPGKTNPVGHAKKARQRSGGDDSNANERADSEAGSASTPHSKPKSGSRNRNRPKSNKESDKGKKSSKSKKGSKGSKDDVDNQEWVQCEKCEKWRKLPPKIAAEDLPEVWYCSMNTWDPDAASCGADEDKMDSSHREFQIMGEGGTFTTSFGSSGKLSYRNLIFGTGRKQNRPISERQRAADSLFSNQPIDGPPTVMYANSSAFVYRGFNQQKSSAEETGKPSFLEVMSQSKLWDELYRGARAIQALSLGVGGYEGANGLHGGMPNECLQLNMFVRSMKALVYHALGSKTLAGHEVLLEAQCRQWDDAQWAELRAACTIEIVTHALEELINDGLVETTGKTTLSNCDALGVGFVKYRRTNVDGLQGARHGEAKNSRCMKISKPWKKARSAA